MRAGLTIGAAALALALAPAGAAAHQGEDSDGLQSHRLADGAVVQTHGQDTIAGIGAGAGAATLRIAPRSTGLERAPLCTSSFHLRLFYAYAAGAENEVAENADRMREIVREANHRLNRDGVESGGIQTDYRVRCAGGQMTIEWFPVSGGTTFNAVLNSLQNALLEAEETNHLVFFDSIGGCGEGSFHNDNRQIENHAANGKGWSVLWRSCWTVRGAMHELGHNMGAVVMNNPPQGPPHTTGSSANGGVEGDGSHCWDGMDVMCQAENLWTVDNTICSDREYFDCNFDDYFHTDPQPGNWLHDHWNLGNPLNKFLNFGGHPPPGSDPGGNSRAAYNSCVARANTALKRARKRAARIVKRAKRKAKARARKRAKRIRKRALARRARAVKRCRALHL